MKYMLLIYGNEAGFASATKTQVDQVMAAYGAYTEAMKKAGVMSAGDPLAQSSSATTVRVANGKSQVLNGPYAETKEQLGGFFVLEAEDMTQAIQLVSKHPGLQAGPFEIRPVEDMTEVVRQSEQRRSKAIAK